MRKYLVTEDQFKACFSQPPPMIGEELSPNARVLTREEVEAAWYSHQSCDSLLDELFGKGDV